MLAAGAVLHLPSGSTAATSTPMTSHVYGTQLPVVGAWTCPVPSSSSHPDPRSANTGIIQTTVGDVKSMPLSAGEYLVSHVVNGKPVVPLTTSAVDHLVAPASSMVSDCVMFTSVAVYKPNSITQTSSELAPNMFEAGSCQIALH